MNPYARQKEFTLGNTYVVIRQRSTHVGGSLCQGSQGVERACSQVRDFDKQGGQKDTGSGGCKKAEEEKLRTALDEVSHKLKGRVAKEDLVRVVRESREGR